MTTLTMSTICDSADLPPDGRGPWGIKHFNIPNWCSFCVGTATRAVNFLKYHHHYPSKVSMIERLGTVQKVAVHAK